MDKDLLIKKLTAYFSDQDDIDIVYLFGSVAKGKERGSIDVDIAVLFSEGMPLLPHSLLHQILPQGNRRSGRNQIKRDVSVAGKAP
jgi:predicted nucleotidyltransferase